MSALGTIFLIYYIFRASTDVVASDYIRIINYYLEDVSDLHFLLSWEGIARIPFNFLIRFINVKIFSYSVFFDKILGTFGLFLFNAVVLNCVLNNLKTKPMKILSSLLITYISFSLMAWEMILNGTGYAHFITTGLISLTFYIFAKSEWANEGDVANAKVRNTFLICILVIITSLLFAGNYSVSYLCTIVFFSALFIIIKMRKREKFLREVFFIISSVICLLLYFKSNNTGEPLIPVGFKDITLLQLLKTEPLFPIKFILKSLASSIIGVETLNYALNFGTINEKFIFLIGVLYLIIIIFVIALLIIKLVNVARIACPYCTRELSECENRARIARLYRMRELNECISFFIFISMFIVSGLANYLLIFLARYKFVVDSYGMTSRYSLQYMFLTIGIIMLLIKLIDELIINHKVLDANVNAIETIDKDESLDPSSNHTSSKGIRIFFITTSILSLSFITLGHLTTNTDEIFKSDYRKIIYSIVEEKAKNYKNLVDQDLEDTFEYHRGPEQIRHAFEILESQKLNIFKN